MLLCFGRLLVLKDKEKKPPKVLPSVGHLLGAFAIESTNKVPNLHPFTYLLDSAGWRFVAVVGYLMLIFSCIPTFWQTKISICRSAHSLFVSLRCIHCALLCKSYVCWHSCRCFKTPLSQSGRALVSSDSQSSPTSHTSVSHTIAVKLLPQRVAGHHRSYSSPTEPDR